VVDRGWPGRPAATAVAPGTQAPSNPRGIHALCTWDDGDTAGMGVGYGQLPAEDLADLLAEAHTQLHG
jgi:hypothetical protein